jgi:hypothetical protein
LSSESGAKGLTTAEYAAHRGCSDSYVRRLRREGRLVLVGNTQGIDAAASDARLDAEGDALRGGSHTAAPDPASAWPEAASGGYVGVVPTVREGQRQKLEQEIEQLRRRNLESARRTVKLSNVDRTVFTLARATLAGLRSLTSRLRGRLAAESDPAVIEVILSAEIEKLCSELQSKSEQLSERRFETSAEAED